MHPYVHHNISYNSQDVETNQVSITGLTNKMWDMYISSHMEYYSVIKKHETSPFVTTWIDLEGKWNKSDEEKYCMISLIYEIKETNKSEQTK